MISRLIGRFNLAPLNYTSKLIENKILDNLVIKEHELLSGVKVYTVMSYLDNSIRLNQEENLKIYGSCDGTGTDESKPNAIHKSISEALERWAFYSLLKSGNHGFDKDPSTNGMAAYPGLNYYKAREFALFESIERWSIVNFWKKNLPIRFRNNLHNIESYEILTPFSNSFVSLLKYFDSKSKKVSYGFAAHKTYELAQNKAIIELTRNKNLLELVENKKTNEITDLYENRVLYFSHGMGLFELNEIIQKQLEKTEILAKTPERIVDESIIGPWTQYTKVWRTIFEIENSTELNFFFF